MRLSAVKVNVTEFIKNVMNKLYLHTVGNFNPVPLAR